MSYSWLLVLVTAVGHQWTISGLSVVHSGLCVAISGLLVGYQWPFAGISGLLVAYSWPSSGY